MIFPELARYVAVRFEQISDRRVFSLVAKIGAWPPDFS